MKYKIKRIKNDASFREFYRISVNQKSSILVFSKKERFKNLIIYCAINQILNKTKDSQGVVFVPAFVGLSSPHWIPDSKAMIYGLTPSINKNHIIRAALESIAFQIKDYLDDLKKNNKINYNDIYIDGGIVSNKSFEGDIKS